MVSCYKVGNIPKELYERYIDKGKYNALINNNIMNILIYNRG